MKKSTVLTIIIITVVLFLSLVFWGFQRTRGIKVLVEKTARVILTVPLIEKEISLVKGLSLPIWDSLPEYEVKLLYQLTVPPWPKSLTPYVKLKSFHNNKELYLYFTWPDETEDWNLGVQKFTDACAIMFPLSEKIQPSTIMMGFMGKSNIWQWKASQDKEYWTHTVRESSAYSDFHYPFEDKELFPVSQDIPRSAVNSLLAIRVGTITPREVQDVEGKGVWDKGFWRVLLKRNLSPRDIVENVIFKPGTKQLCAFAVWNGSKGDRGGRKSISDWVELELK